MTTEKDKNKNNDASDAHKDQIGENVSEDTQLSEQQKSDKVNETKDESSNKGQGPKGENL